MRDLVASSRASSKNLKASVIVPRGFHMRPTSGGARGDALTSTVSKFGANSIDRSNTRLPVRYNSKYALGRRGFNRLMEGEMNKILQLGVLILSVSVLVPGALGQKTKFTATLS